MFVWWVFSVPKSILSQFKDLCDKSCVDEYTRIKHNVANPSDEINLMLDIALNRRKHLLDFC